MFPIAHEQTPQSAYSDTLGGTSGCRHKGNNPFGLQSKANTETKGGSKHTPRRVIKPKNELENLFKMRIEI